MDVKRGEIYYIESYLKTESENGRPAIVVSNDICNKNSTVFEVVYLTTKPKNDLPTHVVIRSTKVTSVAICEQICSVSDGRFGAYYGKCTDREMQLIDAALAISIGISENAAGIPAQTQEPTPEPKTATQEPAHEEDVQLKLQSDAIIELQTERDVYKRLYEQMLERVIN